MKRFLRRILTPGHNVLMFLFPVADSNAGRKGVAAALDCQMVVLDDEDPSVPSTRSLRPSAKGPAAASSANPFAQPNKGGGMADDGGDGEEDALLQLALEADPSGELHVTLQ